MGKPSHTKKWVHSSVFTHFFVYYFLIMGNCR